MSAVEHLHKGKGKNSRVWAPGVNVLEQGQSERKSPSDRVQVPTEVFAEAQGGGLHPPGEKEELLRCAGDRSFPVMSRWRVGEKWGGNAMNEAQQRRQRERGRKIRREGLEVGKARNYIAVGDLRNYSKTREKKHNKEERERVISFEARESVTLAPVLGSFQLKRIGVE